jgi:hypothetical protein
MYIMWYVRFPGVGGRAWAGCRVASDAVVPWRRRAGCSGLPAGHGRRPDGPAAAAAPARPQGRLTDGDRSRAPVECCLFWTSLTIANNEVDESQTNLFRQLPGAGDEDMMAILSSIHCWPLAARPRPQSVTQMQIRKGRQPTHLSLLPLRLLQDASPSAHGGVSPPRARQPVIQRPSTATKG